MEYHGANRSSGDLENRRVGNAEVAAPRVSENPFIECTGSLIFAYESGKSSAPGSRVEFHPSFEGGIRPNVEMVVRRIAHINGVINAVEREPVSKLPGHRLADRRT